MRLNQGGFSRSFGFRRSRRRSHQLFRQRAHPILSLSGSLSALPALPAAEGGGPVTGGSETRNVPDFNVEASHLSLFWALPNNHTPCFAVPSRPQRKEGTRTLLGPPVRASQRAGAWGMYVHLSHVGRSSCDECWDEGVGTGLDWLAGLSCPVLVGLGWLSSMGIFV